MKTLNLQEAAEFLKMSPEGVRRKAVKGEIPGAKPGKCWCFPEDDLAEYLRSLYANTAETSQGVPNRRTLWHSTKEVITGGLRLPTKDLEYKKALGLPIK